MVDVFIFTDLSVSFRLAKWLVHTQHCDDRNSAGLAQFPIAVHLVQLRTVTKVVPQWTGAQTRAASRTLRTQSVQVVLGQIRLIPL
jgi:hypothetical protein